MKTAIIYTFSGTFQTLQIVSSLVVALNQNKVFANIAQLPSAVDAPGNYDIIGFAYPIHHFFPPKTMVDFINNLPVGNNQPFFIIKTAGSTSFFNESSSKDIIKTLQSKSYCFLSEYLIETPYNRLTSPSEDDYNQMFDKNEKLIFSISEKIANSVPTKPNLHRAPILRSILKRKKQLKAWETKSKNINTKACTKCYSCVAICPSNNITVNNGVPTFNNNCFNCMRCCYICPNNAIYLDGNIKIQDTLASSQDTVVYKKLKHHQYQDLVLSKSIIEKINNDGMLGFISNFTNIDLAYGYLRFTEPEMPDKESHNFIYLNNNNYSKSLIERIITEHLANHDYIRFLFEGDYSDSCFSEIANAIPSTILTFKAPINILDNVSSRSDVTIKRLNANDHSLFYSYKYIDEYSKGANYSKRNANRCYTIGLVDNLVDYFSIFQDDKAIGLLCCNINNNSIYISDFSILDTLQQQKFGQSLLKQILDKLSKKGLVDVYTTTENSSTATTYFKQIGFTQDKCITSVIIRK